MTEKIAQVCIGKNLAGLRGLKEAVGGIRAGDGETVEQARESFIDGWRRATISPQYLES